MRTAVRFATATLAAALLSTPCVLTAQTPTTSDAADPLAAVAFAPDLHVDLARSVRLASGVYRRDLQAGSGDSVRSMATLTLRMRVRLPDGAVVAADDRPITRWWLPGTYVMGLEQGLRGMRAGGRRQIVVPAALAYGEQGVPGVPGGTPLVVEVELLGVS